MNINEESPFGNEQYKRFNENTSLRNTTLEDKDNKGRESVYVAQKQDVLPFIDTFHLPENLFLEALLRESDNEWWLRHGRLNKLRFIVSFIQFAYITGANGKIKRNGFVGIPSAVLRRCVGKGTVGKKAFYVAALELLAQLGVIEINPRYRNGLKDGKGFPKSFRLGPKYWNQRTKTVSDRVRMPLPARDASRIENEIQAFVHANIQRVSIDDEGLRRVLALPTLSEAHRARIAREVRDFRRGKINLRAGVKQRRITHALSRCKRELRQALKCEGEFLCEFDVPSCQALLLLSVSGGVPTAEIANFKTFLLTDFYSRLTTHGDREKAKRQFYRFAFGSYKRANELGRNFMERFPNLAARVRGFEGSLSAYLQDAEAEMCIYGVVKRCMEHGIFVVPIHDGFLLKAEASPAVNEFVKLELQRRFGFVVDLKPKNEAAFAACRNTAPEQSVGSRIKENGSVF